MFKKIQGFDLSCSSSKQQAISEFHFPFVSKRVLVQNLSCGNEFSCTFIDFKTKLIVPRPRFETAGKGKLEMADCFQRSDICFALRKWNAVTKLPPAGQGWNFVCVKNHGSVFSVQHKCSVRFEIYSAHFASLCTSSLTYHSLNWLGLLIY